MLPANDAPTQPTKNTERLISSTRSLPYWSPSLPSSGVETAEVSRKAVKSQVRPGGRRVELALEHGQRRDHHRLLHRVGDAGEREHGQRDVVVRAFGRVAQSQGTLLRSRASPLRSSSTICFRARSSPTSAPSRRALHASPRSPTGSTRAWPRRSRPRESPRSTATRPRPGPRRPEASMCRAVLWLAAVAQPRWAHLPRRIGAVVLHGRRWWAPGMDRARAPSGGGGALARSGAHGGLHAAPERGAGQRLRARRTGDASAPALTRRRKSRPKQCPAGRTRSARPNVPTPARRVST